MHGDRYIPMEYYESLEQARLTLREQALLALEKQIEEVEWLNTTQAYETFQVFMSTYGSRKVQAAHSPWLLDRAEYVFNGTKQLLERAPTYYVSHDMKVMAAQAAESMPMTGLKMSDLPSQQGFMYLGTPLKVSTGSKEYRAADIALDQERHPDAEVEDYESVEIQAVAWTVTMVKYEDRTIAGITYLLFTTLGQLAEIKQLAIDSGRWEPKPGDRGLEDLRETYGPLPLWDFSGWAFDNPWREAQRPDEVTYGVLAPVVNQMRMFMLSVWKLLGEKIAKVETEHPPRPLRRRAQRRMPQNGDIIVIKLRREFDPSARYKDETGQELDGPWYSHRHLVRGHWHHYWCGPRDNQTLELKYVAPYIRGPEGAPLIVKDKVFSLEA